MEDEQNLENGAAQTSTAVSIFGQGGSPNDFPVLKAFQEYIDAEQAKARKRMLGLSIFFVVLLMVVVATFAVILVLLVNSKQSLMDRLLDMAMKEKEAPVAAAVAQEDATARLNDRIAALQEKLVQQQLERERAEQAAREAKLHAEQVAREEKLLAEQERLKREQADREEKQRAEQAAREAKFQAEQAALKKALEDQKKALEDQKKALEDQKKKLEKTLADQRAEAKRLEEAREKENDAKSREAERERFLRRQYPDYYAKVDAAKKRVAARKAAIGDKRPDEETEAVEPLPPVEDPPSAKPAKPAKPAPMKVRAAEAATAENLDSIKPIDYFANDVESIDVEDGDEDVPFLIKNPAKPKQK